MTDASPYERQNEPLALSAARAFRRRDTISGRWRSLRVTIGFVIGTVGVLAALIEPATADYISAAAAAWIVTSRALLQPAEHRERRRAAAAQELFDTTVFNLPWSRSVTGAQPAIQDIRAWGRHQTEEGLRDWYPDTRPPGTPPTWCSVSARRSPGRARTTPCTRACSAPGSWPRSSRR